MKPSFAFGDAVSAPFALLTRRPLYVFVWGLMMVAVIVATYSLLLPIFMSVPLNDDSQAAVDAYVEGTARFGAAINGMNLVMYLVMLVLWTAAGRATLSPVRGDRFLFLRLGMDEVRVAVVIIAVFVGWYIGLLVLVLLGLGIGLALWSTNESVAIGVLIVYGLAVFIVSIATLVRVSLIAPATLVLRRLAFAEGWALAKGQVWKLIGLNIVMWLIGVACTLILYAIVGGILLAGFFGQGLEWPSEVASVADLASLVTPMIVPALLTIIPLAFACGLMSTIYAAPAVVAARQLLDGTPIRQDRPGVDALQPQ